MKYTYALLLLVLMGWLASGGSNILAQDTTLPRRTLPAEEPPLNPGEPPTPRFLEVEVGIGADGLGPIRLHYYPPWVAMRRPQLRVGQARTEQPPETETAPRLEGGADQLQQALEQALNRAQHPAAPPPQ
jgi:hypothetical protein